MERKKIIKEQEPDINYILHHHDLLCLLNKKEAFCDYFLV